MPRCCCSPCHNSPRAVLPQHAPLARRGTGKGLPAVDMGGLSRGRATLSRDTRGARGCRETAPAEHLSAAANARPGPCRRSPGLPAQLQYGSGRHGWCPGLLCPCGGLSAASQASNGSGPSRRRRFILCFVLALVHQDLISTYAVTNLVACPTSPPHPSGPVATMARRRGHKSVHTASGGGHQDLCNTSTRRYMGTCTVGY